MVYFLQPNIQLRHLLNAVYVKDWAPSLISHKGVLHFRAPSVHINDKFVSFFPGKPNELMFYSYIGHSHKVQISKLGTTNLSQVEMAFTYWRTATLFPGQNNRMSASKWILGCFWLLSIVNPKHVWICVHILRWHIAFAP